MWGFREMGRRLAGPSVRDKFGLVSVRGCEVSGGAGRWES